MTHTHKWKCCKVTGLLAHLCPPGCAEEREHEHGKEPFLRWTNAHVKPPIPPEKPQLLEKFQVPNIRQRLGYPIYISAFFAKDIGINFGEYSREHAYALIDKIARENLSNTIRLFAYLAYPNVCHYPHPKIGNRKWDVNEIDETWWDSLYDIIKYCAERKIMVRLILFDAHSLNRRWNWHWTNPDCNIGYRGKPMYPDRYGQEKWVNYILKGAECTPEEYAGYETNMEYWLGMYDEIIHRLEPAVKPWVTIDSNEIDGGDHWHNFIGGTFLAERKIPRWRRTTSPRGGEDWINTKKSINRFWLPEVHGIRGVEDYQELKKVLSVRCIPSGDGYGKDWHLGYYDLRKFIRQALRDKCYGIGGNNWLSNKRPGTIQEWFGALDYESGEIMMQELDIYQSEQLS